MMETQHSPQQHNNQSLAKLSFDTIKQNDLKFMFQVLSTAPQNRTIADLDSLVKIMLHIQPIKKLQNMSATYLLCQKMSIQKYKSKDIIYQQPQKSQSLYIILSGKIAFYKKSKQYFDSDEVIFLNIGSCFGKFYQYQWKVKFLPISVQDSLLAVISRNQINKIPLHLSFQREVMVSQLRNLDIFGNLEVGGQGFREASNLLVLNKVPCGSYLIRDGQSPKAIFYILKGVAKNIINKDGKIYEIKRFAQGQYSPRSFKNNYKYDLITETSCQIIVIPKKVFKIINSPHFNLNLNLKGKQKQNMGQKQKQNMNMNMNQLDTQQQDTKFDLDKEIQLKNQWNKYKQNFFRSLVKFNVDKSNNNNNKDKDKDKDKNNSNSNSNKSTTLKNKEINRKWKN